MRFSILPKNKWVLAAELSAFAGLLAFVMQPFVLPVYTPGPLPSADPLRLEAHVRKLSVELHPRNYRSPNLEKTASYIEEVLTESGAWVTSQPFNVEGTRYRNIVARYGPATGSVIVIGAHYDSHSETPGADDNASGVAGLLELGRMLQAHPPTQPVELVAYTLEEPPYFATDKMGSAVHARDPRLKDRIRLMVSLEMIGFFSEEPGSQEYPAPGLAALYPSRGNFIGVVSNLSSWQAAREVKGKMSGATDLPVYSMTMPAGLNGADWSDHRNYWSAGIPAVMVTDTAMLRNKAYHTAEDVPERLDYVRMAKVVQGTFALTR